MKYQASQTVITFAAAGLLAAMALPARAQVFDPGPSDPALFDSVVDIPADVNPFETAHIAPDTAGGTKQINLADGGEIVVLDPLANVENGVELNITGGEISDTLQFSGANFYLEAGTEANISGGTSQDVHFQGDAGSLINVTGGDYLVSPGDGRISTGGTFNMSGGRFDRVAARVANISGDAEIRLLRALGEGGVANIMGGVARELIMSGGSTLNLSGGTVGIGGAMSTSGFNVTLDIEGGLFQTILTLEGGSRAYVRGGAVHWLNAGLSVPDQDPLGSRDVRIDVSGGTIGAIRVRTPWITEGSLPNVATVTGGRVGLIAAEPDAQVRVSGGAVNTFNVEAGADVVFSGGEFMLNGAPYTEPSVELIASDFFTGTWLDGSPFVYQSNHLEGHVTLDTQPVPPADLTPIVVDAPSDLYGLRAGQSLTLRDGGTLRNHFSMVNADLTIEGGIVGVSPLNGGPTKVAGSNILMTGGEIINFTRLLDGSTFTMGGGHIDDTLALTTGSGSVANIYGGSWNAPHNIQGEINLFGSGFALDGVPIEGLVPGEPHEIEEDGHLTGQLADGTSFSLTHGTFTTPGPITVTLFTNTPPVALDDSLSTPEETELTGNVLEDNGNDADSDPDGAPFPLRVSLVTAPVNGDLTLNPDGSFSYTPNMNFFGTDSFDYEVADGNGGTDQATVTITVIPQPELSLMPGIWEFIDVQVGESVLSDPFVVDNTGGSDLVVGTVTIEGPAAGDFQLEDDICSGQTVAPGDFCGFSVRFTPAAAGIRRAEVRVSGNAPESPAVAELIGIQDVVFFDGFEGN